MYKKSLYPLVAVLLGTAVTFNSQAGDKYHGDPEHSEIVFSINHLGFSTTYGKFKEVKSEFVYDAEDPSKSTVTATIKTNSIDFGHDGKNKHLKNRDFFNVEKYPEITFKSTQVSATGDQLMKVTGDLTILGTTLPISMDVTVNKIGKHPFFDKYVGGFSATGKLDRTAFGMNAYAPDVGAEVSFNIEIEGAKVEAD